MAGPRRLRRSARPPLSGTSINAERQFMQELRLAETACKSSIDRDLIPERRAPARRLLKANRGRRPGPLPISLFPLCQLTLRGNISLRADSFLDLRLLLAL
jgi:hypothetical protein